MAKQHVVSQRGHKSGIQINIIRLLNYFKAVII